MQATIPQPSAVDRAQSDGKSLLPRRVGLPRLDVPIHIGYLLPALLALVFVVDLVSRVLVPVELLATRGWEVARHGRGADAPFRPWISYYNPVRYGELAAWANLPELRQYRPERFTTDANGFRNPPDLAERGPIGAITIGSSFTAGHGNSDEDMLSAHLTSLIGRPVYNAAGVWSEGDAGIERIRSVAGKLGIQRGVVILEWLDRFDAPPEMGTVDRCVAKGRSFGLGSLCLAAREWNEVQPVQIVAQRAYAALQNGDVLPRSQNDRVVRARLRGGEPMLFYADDVAAFHRGSSAAPAAAYLRSLRDKLAADGLHLVVVLVPSSYTVYRPLLEDPGAVPRITHPSSNPAENPAAPAGPDYLDRLASTLGADGIATVNLLPTFRSEAATGYEDDRFVYWRDDAHWNPAGVALAARQIARALPR